MAITTEDGYIASAKQQIRYVKTAARTTVATGWFSLTELAGDPGAGTLAGAGVNGAVIDDTVAGFPAISAFGGGATGYLSKVAFGSSVACRIKAFDLLWKGGPYNFNAAAQAIAASSYLAREPNGTGQGLQAWIETVTAFTGNQTFNLTYTNQAGTTGKTTGAQGTGTAPTLGRCWQLPLAAGDTGIQTPTAITGGTGSAGTANLLIMRPLWEGRVKIANDGDINDLIMTGLPRVYDTSALFILVAADSTSSGVPELTLEIANG